MARRRWQEGRDPAPRDPAPRGPARPVNPTGRRLWRSGGRAPAATGKSRRAIKLLFGIAVLVFLLGGAAFAISLLLPVPKPQILLLTANYPHGPIPLNPFAAREAAWIRSQSDVLDGSLASDRSMDGKAMLAAADQAASLAGQNVFFSWEKNTAIVYANSLGAAIWDERKKELVPCLVPEDALAAASGVVNDGCLAVADVCDTLSQSRADHKLLVLDCQRQDQVWPLGVVANDFVKETRRIVEERQKNGLDRDLYVLISCSAGEVAWTDPSEGASTFARAFVHGLSGAADKDSDSRVTLADLFEFVRREVGDWAQLHRGDVQTPILLSPRDGRPESVQLVPLGASRRAAVETSLPPLETPAPDRLRQTWAGYYRKRAGRSTGESEGLERVPTLLLKAESLFLAGDQRGLDAELDAAHSALEARGPSLGGVVPAYSIPMQRLFGPSDERGAMARAVENAATGNADLAAPLPPLAGPRPVEAHFLLMLREHYLTTENAGPRTSHARAAAAREMLKGRLAAEEAATPPLADRYRSGLVARWNAALVGEGDRWRRFHEDRLFAEGALAVPVGPAFDAGADPAAHAARNYASARSTAESVSKAMDVHAALLADLPFLAKLSVKRTSRRQTPDPLDRPERDVRRLVDLAAELGDGLHVDPLSLNADERAKRVERLRASAAEAESLHGKLLAAFAAQMDKAGGSDLPAADQNEWHRLDDLLDLPFPASKDPEQAARLRLNLLRRVRPPVGSATTREAVAGATLEAQDPSAAVRRDRAEIATRLYCLGGERIALPSGAPLPGEIESAVQASYHRLIRPRREDLPLDQLLAAATQAAVRDAVLGEERDPALGEKLGRDQLAWLLRWQAERMIEDFWSGAVGDAAPYYAESGKACLDHADRLAPGGGRDIRARLVALGEIQPKTRAVEKIVFAGYDALPLGLSLEARREAFPAGLAGLRYDADPEVLAVEAASRSTAKDSGAAPFAFDLLLKRTLPTSAAKSITLSPRVAFRGHRFPWTVPVELVNEDDRPAVLVESPRLGNPKLQVRLDAEQTSDAVILFVLDCSASMAAPAPGDAAQRSKMDVMTGVLTRFAESSLDSSVRVGIRVFGMDVDYTAANADNVQLEQQSKTDTRVLLPIGEFSRDAFDRSVATIRYFGSTPLYEAVRQAAADFQGVEEGSKNVILISDGEDSWYPQMAAEEQQAVLRGIKRAYADTGIRIHAIGFDISDKKYLEQIAGLGDRPGSAEQAKKFEELLEKITGIVGSMSYQVETPGEASFGPRRPLLATNQPEEFGPPGRYRVRVLGRGKEVEKTIEMEAGDLHRLVYRKDRLEYEENDFPQPIGRKEAPSSGARFRLLEARPMAAGLELRTSLFRAGGERVGPASFLVRPNKGSAFFAAQGLLPNVGGFHLPEWRITLSAWPESANAGSLEMRWDQKATSAKNLRWEDWLDLEGRPFDAGGAKLTRWRAEGRGAERMVRVTLVAADPAAIGEWTVVWGKESPVRRSRQVYDPTHGVFNGWFGFDPRVEPKALVVARLGIEKASELSIEFPVGSAGLSLPGVPR